MFGTVILLCFAKDARIDRSSSKKARLMNAGNGPEMTAFGGVTTTYKLAVMPPNGKSM